MMSRCTLWKFQHFPLTSIWPSSARHVPKHKGVGYEPCEEIATSTIYGYAWFSSCEPQSKPPPPEPPNKKIKINEGRFVEGSQPSTFSSKMENRPELLTEKPKPRQRKSASDEDIDYDPEEDMCDMEDTLEDIQLEKQTIVENKEKRNYATYM